MGPVLDMVDEGPRLALFRRGYKLDAEIPYVLFDRAFVATDLNGWTQDCLGQEGHTYGN